MTAPVSRPLKVLVAEDHLLHQRLITSTLKELGHTGIVVVDGEKALKASSKIAFDLIIMDVNMPVLDGVNAVAQMQARDRSLGKRTPPIIMATSHDLPGDRERLLDIGAQGYIAKPVDRERLHAEISLVLGR